MACSNTTIITSYYEGKAYKYIMVKDGNSIKINLVNTLDTTEHNGVEICLLNVDCYKYAKELECITFFPNVYVKCDIKGGYYGNSYVEKNIGKEFNETKIKKYKTFAVASKRLTKRILLGNVLYSLDILKFNDYKYRDDYDTFTSFLNNISDSQLAIKLNIGEVDVTPNREAIIYTKNTTNIIYERCLEAVKEIDEVTSKFIPSEFDDMLQLLNCASRTLKIDFFNNSLTEEAGYRNGNITYIPNNTVKYKDKKYNWIDLYYYKIVLNTKLSNYYKGYIRSDNIIKEGNGWKAEKTAHYYLSRNDKYVILDDCPKLTENIKDYLCNRYSGYTLLKTTSNDANEARSKFIADYENNINVPKWARIEILGYLYDDLMKNAVHFSKNDPDFIKFVAEKKQDILPKTPKVDKILLYTYTAYGYREKLEFKDFEMALRWVKSIKAGVILDYIDADNISIGRLANCLGYKFYTANKPIVEAIWETGLTKLKSKEWLLECPKFIKLATIYRLGIFNKPWLSILSYIPDPYKSELKALYEEYSLVQNTIYNHSLYFRNVPDDKLNQNIVNLINICNKYNKAIQEAEEFINLGSAGINSTKKAIVGSVILKNKHLRLSKDAYLNIKNNPLIKLLCTK